MFSILEYRLNAARELKNEGGLLRNIYKRGVVSAENLNEKSDNDRLTLSEETQTTFPALSPVNILLPSAFMLCILTVLNLIDGRNAKGLPFIISIAFTGRFAPWLPKSFGGCTDTLRAFEMGLSATYRAK